MDTRDFAFRCHGNICCFFIMGMILELRRFPAAPPPIMEIQASLTKTAKRKDKERLERKEEERDVFREIPLRYLGYANEVGEAFRHTVPVRVVHLSYVLASSYVVAHAASQGFRASRRAKDNSSTISRSPDPTPSLDPVRPQTELTTAPSLAVADTLVWQGLASVAIPGLTINRLCAVSRFLLSRHAGHLLPQQARKWAVVAVGLGSIPFIIHPIDWSVDRFMDHLIRPWLRKLITDTR